MCPVRGLEEGWPLVTLEQELVGPVPTGATSAKEPRGSPTPGPVGRGLILLEAQGLSLESNQ